MNVLVTNTSSPTFIVTLHALRQAFDCKIVGVSEKESFDKHILDDWHHIEHGEDYLDNILALAKKEKIELLIPQSIGDRILFMKNKSKFEEINVKILSSSAESILIAESKINFMDICRELDIPVPDFYVASTYQELSTLAKKLGYPEKKVVVKPVDGSGSKGFRILNKKTNFRRMFAHHRPDHPEITLSNLRNIIGDKFQPLIVSEYLCGEEYTIDGLRQNDTEFYLVRDRVETKNGLTSVGKIVQDKQMQDYSKKLAKKLNLTTVFGFQFRKDENGVPKALECNPRIQGTMSMTTLCGANIIAASAAMLLNKEPIKLDPDYTMKFYRMHSGIGVGRDITKINF